MTPEQNQYAEAVTSIWLDDATRGLCDSARERIAAETQAHCRDAYEAGLAQGLEEEAALKQALNSLGSSRAARKRFAKVYITTDDLKALDYVYGKKQCCSKLTRVSIFVCRTFALFCAIHLGIHWISSRETYILYSALLIGYFALDGSPKYIVRRAYQNGRLRKAILLNLWVDSFSNLVQILLFWGIFWSIKDVINLAALLQSYGIIFVIVWGLFVCFGSYFDIRLLRKLSRFDSDDELRLHTEGR